MQLDEPFFAVVDDAAREGADPPNDHADYVGTRLRAPKQPLVILPATETELTGPAYGESAVESHDADLTRRVDPDPELVDGSDSGSSWRGAFSAATGRRFAASSSRSGRPTPLADISTPSTPMMRRSTRTSPVPAAA